MEKDNTNIAAWSFRTSVIYVVELHVRRVVKKYNRDSYVTQYPNMNCVTPPELLEEVSDLCGAMRRL